MLLIVFYFSQQSRYTVLKRHSEKQEMELTQLHVWQAEALDGELDDDMDGKIYYVILYIKV